MKKLLIVLFSILIAVPIASAKDEQPGRPIEMDTVIQVPNLTQQQIYEGLKVWFANSMNDANRVIQLDDRDNAHIIGKANIPFKVNNLTWGNLTGCIHFTIDVQARDGRFRLKLNNFNHESFNKQYGDGWSEGIVCFSGKPADLRKGHGKQYSEMQKRAVPLIIDNMASIIVSIQSALTSATSPEEEDW